ncbi:hypothetical protein HJC22_19140 [Corallococcus exiguus]|uniref:hypothetical protein n=1 Tax=Corallococcus exiguus TaxID=83462 RepID=UPI0014716E39|nr:hypothetical protein [Corallococcus exiguus]NNC17832.1 hypothetical protein [Corallococcus exiguus]
MAEWKEVVPIVSVCAGWFLNEFGAQLRGRREDRKPLARALAELMELYHREVRMGAFVRAMKEKLGASPQLILAVQVAVETMLNDNGEVGKRYGEAVTLVSSVDPVLGFRLRSRDALPRSSLRFRQAVSKEVGGAEYWGELGPLIERNVTESLREAIVDVAWKHGLLSWIQVRRWLRRSPGEVAELNDFSLHFERFKGVLEKTQGAELSAMLDKLFGEQHDDSRTS